MTEQLLSVAPFESKRTEAHENIFRVLFIYLNRSMALLPCPLLPIQEVRQEEPAMATVFPIEQVRSSQPPADSSLADKWQNVQDAYNVAA
jgi:hypothetical protein